MTTLFAGRPSTRAQPWMSTCLRVTVEPGNGRSIYPRIGGSADGTDTSNVTDANEAGFSLTSPGTPTSNSRAPAGMPAVADKSIATAKPQGTESSSPSDFMTSGRCRNGRPLPTTRPVDHHEYLRRWPVAGKGPAENLDTARLHLLRRHREVDPTNCRVGVTSQFGQAAPRFLL